MHFWECFHANSLYPDVNEFRTHPQTSWELRQERGKTMGQKREGAQTGHASIAATHLRFANGFKPNPSASW